MADQRAHSSTQSWCAARPSGSPAHRVLLGTPWACRRRGENRANEVSVRPIFVAVFDCDDLGPVAPHPPDLSARDVSYELVAEAHTEERYGPRSIEEGGEPGAQIVNAG